MGRTSQCVHRVEINYGTTPVTTAAWVELIAAMPVDCREIEVFDSSGNVMLVGYGPVGSEQTAIICRPGGPGRVEQLLNKGMRIVAKALDTNSTEAGTYLIINFYR